MSLVRANEIAKSIISREYCKGCEHLGYEHTSKVSIPFCLRRYFGKKCVKEVME